MMKNNRLLGVLILMCSTILSCEKSLDTYSDVDGVYFNKRTTVGALLTEKTEVTFAYVNSGEDMQITIPIQMFGQQSDVDRVVKIEVASENATLGSDYILPEKVIIPAGKSSFDYIITLKRSEAILTQAKSLRLKIVENENFKVLVRGENDANGELISALEHEIVFSELFTKAPAGWFESEEDPTTKFTSQKFLLTCEIMKISRNDFNNSEIIGFNRFNYILAQMLQYAMEMLNSGTPILDENNKLIFIES